MLGSSEFVPRTSADLGETPPRAQVLGLRLPAEASDVRLRFQVLESKVQRLG